MQHGQWTLFHTTTTTYYNYWWIGVCTGHHPSPAPLHLRWVGVIPLPIVIKQRGESDPIILAGRYQRPASASGGGGSAGEGGEKGVPSVVHYILFVWHLPPSLLRSSYHPAARLLIGGGGVEWW